MVRSSLLLHGLPNQASLDSRSTRQLFSLDEWKQLANRLSLPYRQQQIAYLILAGHGDKQIASKLRISLPTVRTHVGRLLERLKVRKRQELILTVFLKYWTSEVGPRPDTDFEPSDVTGDPKVADAVIQ
jgi:DNA-binding NarL/FixJ family response regulator